MLVGRGPQRSAIDRAIAAAARGRSTVIALSGPPGIGKTRLLDHAAEQADDMSLLRANGVESEGQIPFASLLELLRPALAGLSLLSPPQASALERAFGLRPGRAPDRFAVGAATLGLLAALADARSLMILLDDIQWFDAPSSAALRFALRRLRDDAVVAVLAVREGHSSLLDGTDLTPVGLAGLSPAEARELRPDLTEEAAGRLVSLTSGNPLALLELAPDPDELALAPPGSPVLVSARVSAGYLRRAAALDATTRRCLLLAATSDTGDLQLLSLAARRLEVDIEALLAAETAGLITVQAGRVRFQHPLIRSAVYSDATAGARREAHRALAAVLSDHDRDRRAWHLAAAAVGTDETAAFALEQAARHSLERGGYATATAAFERGARLTSDPARRAALLVDAAQAAWDAGDGDRAERCLAESRASAAAAPETQRAAAWLAGRIATNRGPVMEGHAILTAAAERAGSDHAAAEAAIAMLSEAALACFMACEIAELAAVAARAAGILRPGASPAARLRVATTLGMAQILGGNACAGARRMHEAVTVAGERPELLGDPGLLPWLALAPLFLRESDVGRARLEERALGAAREQGAIGSLPFLLGLVARDHATTDRWRLAEATYQEALALARESDQRTEVTLALAGLAWLQARQGRARECAANATEAIALAAATGARLHALWSLTALGESELAMGRPQAALEHFARQRELAAAVTIRDVDLWPAAEMVEAHLRLGHADAAGRLAAEFHAAAAAKGLPWSLARALRAQAMVAPDGAAAELFEAAVDRHRQTPDSFELARTQLAYGEWLRRARRRTLARIQLRQAEEVLATLGARPWAARAAAELEATGERVRRGEPNTVEELTPQELQIAVMLASGRTTREAAAALFLSPKTIEYHLRHVYLKLGVRTREDLARLVLVS